MKGKNGILLLLLAALVMGPILWQIAPRAMVTPEEAEQNLAEQKQRYEENFLQDVVVLDQKKTALETESGLQWEITYTLQGEIGRQQELYLQD